MPRSPSPPPEDPAPNSARPVKQVSPKTVALIVASALFMEQLDGTILSTALPAMAGSFHVDPLHMSAALTAYLLSLAVFIPVSGKAADRFGSRTIFRAAIALFTIGSILCAQAPNLPFLIGARMLQGAGGAMMVPVGRLVLLRSVSKSELVGAMAWLMIPASIGPILGPPLGGLIVTYLDWRWIFYINVPIGFLGMALVSRYIAEIREPGPVSFDAIGFVLSGMALACLTFGFEFAGRGVGAPSVIMLLLAAGIVSGWLYLRHAQRHDQPVLDLRLMQIPTFRLSVLAGTLSRIIVGALPFLLPMMLQLGFGVSAFQSGLVTFSSGAGALLMRLSAPVFIRRLGFRNVLVWVGLAAVLSVTTSAAFRPAWPAVVMCGILLIGGFFQSLQFMAYNTIAYADVPRPRMSAATSFYATFQQLTLSLGIATAASVLALSMRLAGHAEPELSDFSAAFLVVGAFGAMAPLISLKFDRAAGSELSGHQPLGRRAPAE